MRTEGPSRASVGYRPGSGGARANLDMNPTLPQMAHAVPALLFVYALALAAAPPPPPFGAVPRDADATDASGPSYPSVECGGPGPCDAGSERSTDGFVDAESVTLSGEDSGVLLGQPVLRGRHLFRRRKDADERGCAGVALLHGRRDGLLMPA